MTDQALFDVPGGPIRIPDPEDERVADLVARANREIDRARENPPDPAELRERAADLRRRVEIPEREVWCFDTKAWVTRPAETHSPSPVALDQAKRLEDWAEKLEAVA